MTRARDRLYVCGTKKQSTDAAAGWHALVSNALEPECRRVEVDGELVALEWRAEAASSVKKRQEKQYAMDLAEIPAWAECEAPPASAGAPQLAPSTALRLGDDHDFAAVASSSDAPAEPVGALVRGRLIHRLLQSLPDHLPGRRRAVGTAYLAAIAPKIDGAAMLDEVMALLDDPRLTPLFAAGSRAEVEIAGRIALPGGAVEISGRIDRLAVMDGRVFIVDYKTNRPAPRRLDEVPEAYVVQLALYRHVLERLYPDRPVTAALLWTDSPLLMEIPSQLLDDAVATLIATESADL
jgi:ATP-dependent helicase/nuclease subunit A